MKGANFFALNKMLYHLVARCCEASAQIKSQLKVKILHESNIDIPCLAFFVDRHKTSTTQHIQVFPHKKSFLMCLHFALAYKLVLDNGEDDFLFPDYAKRLKYDNTNKIDSKTSNIFSDYYQNLVSVSKKYDQQIDHFEEFDSGCKLHKLCFHNLQYLIN